MTVTTFSDRIKARIVQYLPLLVIASLGIGFVIVYTRYGAGLGGDATRYVLGAMNLLDGNGYCYLSGGGEIVPITSFPPFFPYVLVGVGWTGLDLFEAARLINAALFGMTVFLSGYFVYRYTESMWSASIASCLILVSSTAVELFGWAMSEGLYIFLMLITILGLIHYLKERKFWILVVTGVIAGLATITRYVGLSQVGAIALLVLLLERANWKQAITRASIFSALGVAPLGVWFWRNAQLAGTMANRSFMYHPMRGELLRQYLEEISSWLIPMQLELSRIRHRLIFAGGVLIVSAVLVLYPRIKQKVEEKIAGNVFDRLPMIVLASIAWYFVVLFLNSTFLDAGTTTGSVPRYLVPVFILTVILATSVLSRELSSTAKFSISRIGILAIVLILAAINVSSTLEIINDPGLRLGYVTAMMYWTEEVEALQQIEPTQTIVTNNMELTYILTGRTSYMMPINFNQNNQAYNPDFYEQIMLAHQWMADDGILVIYGYGELDSNSQIVVEELKVVPQQVYNMAKIFSMP